MIERTPDIETPGPFPPYLGLIPGRDLRSERNYGPRFSPAHPRTPRSHPSGLSTARAPPSDPDTQLRTSDGAWKRADPRIKKRRRKKEGDGKDQLS
jgi:hypothetical protein